ncbi:YdcF family protein [Tsukamurella sp. NPDC003166]|uniref:YdcF family protein n=1 Tax=Tsukamurella sp. NPDC003166 TaxID=3154444 RepID=UPI0033B4BAAF
MRRWQKLLWVTAVLVVAVLAAVGGVGYVLFGVPHEDPLRKVDAIIVLGGEHDSREYYGIRLAQEGYAKNVVLSNPYAATDRTMQDLCDTRIDDIAITCERPAPSTTRGEAMFTRRLSERHGWKSVIVISWGYHLTRSRYIFDRCYSGETVLRAVPRSYDYGPADWELVYLYQFFGTAKAVVQGSC